MLLTKITSIRPTRLGLRRQSVQRRRRLGISTVKASSSTDYSAIATGEAASSSGSQKQSNHLPLVIVSAAPLCPILGDQKSRVAHIFMSPDASKSPRFSND